MTITVSITRSPSLQDTYLDIDDVAAYLTKFNHGTVASGYDKFTVDTVSIVLSPVVLMYGCMR